MPPDDLDYLDDFDLYEEDDYLNMVLEEEEVFEDIRRYSLVGNPSSPAVSSRLSQNTSSPEVMSFLSTNSSSPEVVGLLSTNTSSPAIGNLESIGILLDQDSVDMYDNDYGGDYEDEYDEYEDFILGEVSFGLNSEEDWEVQSLTLPESFEQSDFEATLEAIEEILGEDVNGLEDAAEAV